MYIFRLLSDHIIQELFTIDHTSNKISVHQQEKVKPFLIQNK